jgi:antitoxin component YwqK of YwqJK toxin-antitoxin module
MQLRIVYFMPLFIISCSPSRQIDRIFVQNNQSELIRGDSIIWFSTTGNKPVPRKDLVYFSYFKNKIGSSQGHYNGRLLNGNYQLMNRNHKVVAKGEFVDGLMHNEWIKWHGNGLIASVENWRYGRLNGRFQKYDEAGRLLLEGRYKNNLYDGKWVYYQDDNSTHVEEYKKGELFEKKQKQSRKDKKITKTEDYETVEN